MPGPKARLRLDGADPINRGLVGFWPLTDKAGSRARDISPRRADGNLVNFGYTAGSGWGSGQSGPAVFFDGTNDHVNVGQRIPQNGSFSASLWFKYNTANRAFFGRGLDIFPDAWSVSALVTAGNVINVTVVTTSGGPAGYGFSGTTTLTAGNWYHVVIVYQEAGTISAYLNGSLEGSASLSGSSVLRTANSETFFGLGENGGGVNRWLNGAINNARIFNRVVRPFEVDRLYADPWAGTARPRRRVYASPAPAMLTATIAGTVDITASVSAAMALDAQIAGTVPITASATAALDLAATIGATVPITASIQAQLSRIATITGEIPITASIQATNGGGGDTHDGYMRRSRRQRALEAAERRREVERLADAQALRLELQAAMGMAADAVAEAPAQAVEAVQEAVAVVQALPAPAAVVDFTAARAAIADLLATIEAAQRAKALADDDEEVEMLLRAL